MWLRIFVYFFFSLALVFFCFNAGVDHGRNNQTASVLLRKRSLVRKVTTSPVFIVIAFLCGFIAMVYAG